MCIFLSRKFVFMNLENCEKYYLRYIYCVQKNSGLDTGHWFHWHKIAYYIRNWPVVQPFEQWQYCRRDLCVIYEYFEDIYNHFNKENKYLLKLFYTVFWEDRNLKLFSTLWFTYHYPKQWKPIQTSITDRIQMVNIKFENEYIDLEITKFQGCICQNFWPLEYVFGHVIFLFGGIMIDVYVRSDANRCPNGKLILKTKRSWKETGSNMGSFHSKHFLLHCSVSFLQSNNNRHSTFSCWQ